MIDPDFDPLARLNALEHNNKVLINTVNQLVESNQQQGQLLVELSDQLLKLTKQQADCQQGLLVIMEQLDDEH